MADPESSNTESSNAESSNTVTARVDAPRLTATALSVLVALVVATAVSLIGLRAIGTVDWPAYNSSNVTRALTTVGQVAAIAMLVIAALLYRYGKARSLIGSLIATALSAGGIATLVTVTLGMPLGATRLYLFGLSVDQEFRTEYLTRLTSSPELADMTFQNLAPYYPAGWFWLGGRYADLAGLPGWEAYKPWSILSMALAGAVAVVLWNRMVGVDKGVAAALAVTLGALMYASPEPYAAVLVLLGVPMLITIMYALRGRSRLADGATSSLNSIGTSWPAVLAAGCFIGLSATFYTLYTGVFAGVTVMMAAYLAVEGWLRKSNKALPMSELRAARRRLLIAVAARLAAIGAVATLVALTVWGPYLFARLSNARASGGTAEHYLPESGAVLPTPMFATSLIGAITMIGLLWILLRFRERTIALAFAVTVVGIYIVCLMSMLRTVLGSTLLSFRLEPLLVAVLGAAGVFGVVEIARWLVGKFGDVRFLVGAVAVIASVAVAQGVPGFLGHEVTTAYTDTDGYGERADQRPPGAESYYPEIHDLISEQTGRGPTENVVLTADFGLLSIYPYWGFHGLTSHYANPLAEFDKRAVAIEEWAESSSTEELIEQMDSTPWEAPNVFLFRYGADGYTLRLAEDVYPNDPNVRRYTVTFDPTLFRDSRFEVTEVGPFVLVVRHS